MDNTQTEVSPTSDRRMIASRVIDTPAALVFNAWTEPKQFGQWWGPADAQTSVHEMDVVPDGVTRLAVRGSDGTEHLVKLVYTDIQAARLLSYTQSRDVGSDEDAAAFSVTVHFEDQGQQQTRITMQTVFRSATERDRAVNGVGAATGADQLLERLAKFLQDFLPSH